MTAVDTNLLVYAHREDSPWHHAALRAIQQLAEGTRPWAVPWPCVHEFLAIVTHPRIYRPATPPELALAAIRAWMASPSLHLIGEGPEYFDRLEQLVRSGKVIGPMIHDARIAALCLEHGIRTFWTADRDFSRFPALNITNPLVA